MRMGCCQPLWTVAPTLQQVHLQQSGHWSASVCVCTHNTFFKSTWHCEWSNLQYIHTLIMQSVYMHSSVSESRLSLGLKVHIWLYYLYDLIVLCKNKDLNHSSHAYQHMQTQMYTIHIYIQVYWFCFCFFTSPYKWIRSSYWRESLHYIPLLWFHERFKQAIKINLRTIGEAKRVLLNISVYNHILLKEVLLAAGM